MRREEDRFDLSALDPENDPERVDRVTRLVLERLGPGIVEGPSSLRGDVSRLLARRFQPLFSAASLVAAVAAILLVRSIAPRNDAPDPAMIAVPAAPEEWAAWLVTGPSPRTEDILFLVSGVDR